MNYKKIFIVSLFLLAIIAIGSVSASEDISDDSVTAIDSSDEAIDQAVDEAEPTDEAIGQAIEETEPTEEVISESVDDIEIEKSDDSNKELTDIDDDFQVYFYNNTFNNNVIYIHSSCNKNGTMSIYVDNIKFDSGAKSGASYSTKTITPIA